MWEAWEEDGGGPLDIIIATRIKELRQGLNGCNSHTWRALAAAVTGEEDQMLGADLERRARQTLGENGPEWDKEWD